MVSSIPPEKKETVSDLNRGYQKRFFELHPGIRDLSRRKEKAEKIQFLLTERIKYPLGESVALDIGCSSGVITCALSRLFAQSIGIEFDEIALQNRPYTDCQAVFIQGDAMSLPIADRSIDIIICAQVYEHVPNDERLAAEMFRVLKPGGIVFFSGPNKLYPIELHYSLPFLHWLPANLADAYLRLLRSGDHYYERSRTVWSLVKLFKGFEIVDLTLDVLQREFSIHPGLKNKILKRFPRKFWRLLLPVFPNFNWFLIKPVLDVSQ